MRSKGYSSRLVRLSFILSVSLLGGSVSVHSASTRTWLAFIGHKNHTKLNRFWLKLCRREKVRKSLALLYAHAQGDVSELRP